MKNARHAGWRRIGVCAGIVVLLALAAVRLCAHDLPAQPEIALVIGEPYEDMRKRSTADIESAIPGHFWGNLPKSDARLRFIDPQYGFVTPLARYFTVTFGATGLVEGVELSPQIEPLLLDDCLKVVIGLQDQWRRGGWKPIWPEREPPFADTPERHAQLRDGRQGTTYWRAGDKYQALLSVHRFTDDKRPDEERYLITLALAKPRLE
jgi:hypothetical protein